MPVLSWLSARDRDVDTVAGRGRERYRRVALTAITSGAARGAAMVAIFVSVPIALHALGREDYGIFVTVTSVTAFVSLLDFGVGNAVLNVLARARGVGDLRASREAIATASVVLLALATALGLLLAVVFPVVPWGALFNAPHSRDHQLHVAVIILAGGILIGLPINLVQRIQVAQQDGFWMNFGMIAGALLSVSGTVAAASVGASLSWFVLVAVAAPLLGTLIGGVVYLRRNRELVPSFQDVRRDHAGMLIRLGWGFLILQMTVVVTYQSDAMVVAHVIGPSAVTDYAVPMRLFTIVPMAFSLFVSPLWPAYGEAIERGDLEWVRLAFRRSVTLVLTVAVPVAAALGLLARPVISAWVGGGVAPSPLFLGALVGWAITLTFAAPISIFLNGAGVIHAQAAIGLGMIAANLVLSIVLTQALGVSGVVWGTVIAQAVFVAAPSVVLARRRLRALSLRSSLMAVMPEVVDG